MPVPHVPTPENRELVLRDSGMGVPHDTIADSLGITKRTLYRYYRKELNHGVAVTNRRVGGKLYELAMAGNVAAVIFWLKCHAGWRQDGPPQGSEKQALVDPDADV